jgi:hypothetical protein
MPNYFEKGTDDLEMNMMNHINSTAFLCNDALDIKMVLAPGQSQIKNGSSTLHSISLSFWSLCDDSIGYGVQE